MLTVTENAATAIKGLLTGADEPAQAGLRIGAKAGAARLSVEITESPLAGDSIVRFVLRDQD